MHNQPLVIGQYQQRAIGEVLDINLRVPFRGLVPFTGIVVAERAEADWRLCLASLGADPTERLRVSPCWFYEVLTD